MDATKWFNVSNCGGSAGCRPCNKEKLAAHVPPRYVFLHNQPYAGDYKVYTNDNYIVSAKSPMHFNDVGIVKEINVDRVASGGFLYDDKMHSLEIKRTIVKRRRQHRGSALNSRTIISQEDMDWLDQYVDYSSAEVSPKDQTVETIDKPAKSPIIAGGAEGSSTADYDPFPGYNCLYACLYYAFTGRKAGVDEDPSTYDNYAPYVHFKGPTMLALANCLPTGTVVRIIDPSKRTVALVRAQ